MRYAIEAKPAPCHQSFWVSVDGGTTDLYTDIKWFDSEESAHEEAAALEQLRVHSHTRVVEDDGEKMCRIEGVHKVWVRMSEDDPPRIAATMN